MNVAQSPGTVNFTAYSGQDFSHTLTFYTRDAEGEKVLQSLTDHTARMQVRLYSGGEALLELTSSDGLVITSGSLVINILRSRLALLESSREYRYDLKTYYAGKARRRIEGAFIVRPAITED